MKAAGHRARGAKSPVAGGVAAPRRSLVWLQGLACGALATLATPLAALLAVLLLPGFLVLLIDRVPGKPVARAMLLCGAAASVAPARQLWDHGLSMDNSLDLIANMLVVSGAWAAAAAGWLLAELAPVVVLLVLEATTRRRLAELRGARARLAADWGLAAAEDDPGPG